MIEEDIEVVIADDDEASLKLMDMFLKMEAGIKVVGKANNGKELIETVNQTEPKLAIVDITMPELNGFEAIKQCIRFQPDLVVIFVTGISDYATQAFDISAVDYILKPFNPDRLLVALEKAKEKICANQKKFAEKQQQHFIENEKTLPKNLLIRNESQYAITMVPLDEIIFIEKEKNGRRVFIHTKEKIHEAYDTVAALLTKVDFRFIQTHRSFIVNVNYIKEIIPSGTVYQINFKDYSSNANISKNYLQSVVTFIENFMTKNG